jgi:hypothetical protein
MVGQRLMASAAVAAFVPAELRPDHFAAAGTLTQAELPARDLGQGRLPFNCLPFSACGNHACAARILDCMPDLRYRQQACRGDG